MDAKSNRRWSAAPAWWARGDSLRRAVVLAFGTNAGTDGERARPDARRDRAQPDGRRRHLHGPFARVEQDNAELREIVAGPAQRPPAEWDAALAGTSGQLQPDGIHPSLEGSHLYAKTVRPAFAELSQATRARTSRSRTCRCPDPAGAISSHDRARSRAAGGSRGGAGRPARSRRRGRGGRPGAVLVAGEAGVGKTRRRGCASCRPARALVSAPSASTWATPACPTSP